MPPPIDFILNGTAGANTVAEAEALIPRIAAEHGAEARLLIAHTGAELAAFAKQPRPGAKLVVAGGGDGTISCVASHLVGAETTLGVLPMGTLNHFAKDLDIPLDLEAAIQTLFTGRTASVDVGEVNDRIFLNNSSIGLYPQIVRERVRQQKTGLGKWPAFAQATAQILRRAATLHVDLAGAEGKTALRGTPFLFVGNNRYQASGLEIGTREALDAGTLWLCAAPHAGRLKLAGLAIAALLGRASKKDLLQFDTTETWVRTRHRRLDVSTDGEVTRLDTPLHYRIRPAALHVIVPN